MLRSLRRCESLFCGAPCELVSELESKDGRERRAAWWWRELQNFAARFAHRLVYDGVARSFNDFKLSDRTVRLDP